MAKVLQFTLNEATVAITGARYEVYAVELDEISLELTGRDLNIPVGGVCEINVESAPTLSIGDEAMVKIDAYNGSNPNTFLNTAGITTVLDNSPPPVITPFDFDKVVFLGASITDQSVSPQATRDYGQSYLKTKYGKDVTIIERATAGWDVATLRANIDTIIADYAGESLTAFAIHAGGNDVIVDTQFLDLPQGVQDQMVADLEYIYDAIHAQGQKLLQSSISFRDYGGITIDNDPAVKVNELRGSYTYTRDWIVPVMKSKAPEYVLNDWPQIDLYNATRNVYEDWKDGSDVVHPNKWARIIYMQEIIESFTQLSLGNNVTPVLQRNFNDTPANGTAIDVVFGLGATEVTDTATGNINWWGRSKWDTGVGSQLRLQNNIDTSGAATAVELYAYVARAFDGSPGNTADPTNVTNTLERNELLLSHIRGNSSGGYVLYVMVDGLVPLAKYTLSEVSGRNSSGSNDNGVFLHKGTSVTVNISNGTPQDNILVNTDAVADHMGRLFVAVEELTSDNIAVMNGIRIQSNG